MQQGLPTLKIGVLAGPALPADLADGQFSSMVVASRVRRGRRRGAPPAQRAAGAARLRLEGPRRRRARVGAVGRVHRRARAVRRARHGRRAARRAVTRAVAEASRLGVAAGAEARTFAGLAGLGNLLVRATDRSPRLPARPPARRRRASPPRRRAPRARAPRSPAPSSRASSACACRCSSGVAAVLAGRAEPREAAKLVGDYVADEE